jgi:hypothetical protein
MIFRDDAFTTHLVVSVLVGCAMLVWIYVLDWFCDSVPLPIRPKKEART